MSMQCIVVRKYCLLMHNTHAYAYLVEIISEGVFLFLWTFIFTRYPLMFNVNFLWSFHKYHGYLHSCMKMRMLMQKLFGPIVCLYIPMWCFSEKSQLSKSIILYINRGVWTSIYSRIQSFGNLHPVAFLT